MTKQMSLYCGSHSHISQLTFLMSALHVVTRANRPFRTQLSVQWLVNRLNWNKNIRQVQGPSLDLTVSKSSASFQQWQSFTHQSTDIDKCFFQQVQHKRKSLQILMRALQSHSPAYSNIPKEFSLHTNINNIWVTVIDIGCLWFHVLKSIMY